MPSIKRRRTKFALGSSKAAPIARAVPDDLSAAAVCAKTMTGRQMPYSVLLTRTNPLIRTRNTTHVQQGLIRAGIPVLETELHEREAFRSLFSFRQPLSSLNPGDVANLDKAQKNVESLTLEILQKLAPPTEAAAGGGRR